MSDKESAVVECLLCRTQAIGNTLEDALEKLKCKGEETWNPLHKAAIQVDSKLVFELKQKIPDNYHGTTRLTGEPTPAKVHASKPKKTKEPEPEEESKQEDLDPKDPKSEE